MADVQCGQKPLNTQPCPRNKGESKTDATTRTLSDTRASSGGQSYIFHNAACPSKPLRVFLPSLDSSPIISTKVWRSSLLLSAYMLGLPVHASPPNSETGEAVGCASAAFRPAGANLAEGKDVLEVGCGRALPGLVAVQAGARRVALSDCDHRCLEVLLECLKVQEAHDCSSIDVFYQLWEEEQRMLEDLDLDERIEGPIAHWSNHWKSKGSSPTIPEDDTFDLVLLSDSLYFEEQVVPVVAMLRRRLRKGGLGIIVIPTRGSTCMAADVSEALTAVGFSVCCDNGPFDWHGLGERHVVGFEAEVDPGEHNALLVKWAPGPLADHER